MRAVVIAAMIERTADCEKEREYVAGLIYLYRRTRLSLPAERLCCLYIQWSVYIDAICKEVLWKKMCSHRNK